MAFRARSRSLLSLVWVARIGVLALMVAVAVLIDDVLTERHRADVRQQWQTGLNDLGLKLQSTILQNVQTVWGLAATVSVKPDIRETEFRQLASVIFDLAPQLRNIGLAPDLTIRNIYPLEGNEAALGLDLTRNSLSPTQIQTLIQSKRALFSGPIDLVQGGKGMAARIPIFEQDTDRFWGVISVILDLERLYREAGLERFAESGHLALFSKPESAPATAFYGDTNAEWHNPVDHELTMPGINWQLLAEPGDGWPSHPQSPWMVRGLLAISVLVVFAGTYWLTSLLLRDFQMQRRFWGLFELAPFGIGLYSTETGGLLRSNNSFDDMFGKSANDLAFFRSGCDRAGRERPEGFDILYLLRKNLRFTGLEGYFPLPEAGPTPLLLHGLTLDSPNGEPVIWLIAEDLSEKKKAERVKNEFISTVSHELRTPLTSIAGSLGLLANEAVGELPPQAARLAEIAHRNTLQLTFLINDLLDIEKLMAGKLEFAVTDCPVEPLIQECAEQIENFSEEKRIRLTIGHLDAVVVKADAARLSQALNNLLSNAIKFSRPNDPVEIYTEVSPDTVRICVRDQGPGVPLEFHDRIFERFSQADSSDRRLKGGTGLGLAITRELMRAMGGDVGFHSEPGAGACFWLSLPLNRPAVS